VVHGFRTRVDQASSLQSKISDLIGQLEAMQQKHKNEKRELKNNKEYTSDCLEQALTNIEYIEQTSKKKRTEM
jgi:hypothetical protein